eukprot:TRINITY_DN11063_c0_g1_i10.p2 TRINITY_DN11063_c0_g1~~TRINITY_DN11063_c0_g1_i10.p2  ORF type:complete len:138 (+),score=35.80 TRINITY_DN11063_c0_g1_i10:2009-2422(+)
MLNIPSCIVASRDYDQHVLSMSILQVVLSRDTEAQQFRTHAMLQVQDGDGDAWVEKEEFAALLRNLIYFVKVFTVFAHVDKNSDRRLNRSEIKAMLQRLDMEDQLDQVFATADANDGGMILFDEFCASLAKLAFKTV